MSRKVNWSTSFHIVGAFGELEGICSSILDGEIMDIQTFEKVSSLKSEQAGSSSWGSSEFNVWPYFS